MKKIILIITCIAIAPYLSAQKVNLKIEIDAPALKALNALALEAYEFTSELQINFNSSNLSDSKNVKGDKPAKLESIIELEKTLKGDNTDADIYAGISGIYSRLNMNEQAEINRQRAINLYNAILEARPDSVEAMFMMASVYLSAGRFEDSKDILRKAQAIKPDYEDPNLFIPMLFMFQGQYDSVYPYIVSRIELYPDKHSSYVALPIYYFYKLYFSISQMDQTVLANRSIGDSLMEMDLLKAYYDRNPTDTKRKYLYNVSKEVLLSTYLAFKTATDSTFDRKNIKFNVSGNDKKSLEELAQYFESCMKTKGQDNYLPNKMLGNINLILDRPKEAVKYYKKAIALKPLNKSTLMCNAADDYDNIITCYFILKDTASCEKWMLEKIKVNPAIDPVAKDYLMLGSLYNSKRNFLMAEKYYNEAFKIKKNDPDVILAKSMLLVSQDKHKEANDLINQAYAINKDAWQVYFLSGVISLKEKDIKNAYEYFLITKKLNGGDWVDEEVLNKYFITN